MSEQLYRVCWQWQTEHRPHYGQDAMSKADADADVERTSRHFGDMIRIWAEPVPPYAAPAITHEDDLETRAGSPRNPLDPFGLEGLE